MRFPPKSWARMAAAGKWAEILGISETSNGCKARILGISGANLNAQVSKLWQEREWLLRG